MSSIEVPSFLKKTIDKIEEVNSDAVVSVNETEIDISDNKELPELEKKEIERVVVGMSQVQIDYLLDNIPIELVYNRVGRELERNKRFAKAITEATKILN